MVTLVLDEEINGYLLFKASNSPSSTKVTLAMIQDLLKCLRFQINVAICDVNETSETTRTSTVQKQIAPKTRNNTLLLNDLSVINIQSPDLSSDTTIGLPPPALSLTPADRKRPLSPYIGSDSLPGSTRSAGPPPYIRLRSSIAKREESLPENRYLKVKDPKEGKRRNLASFSNLVEINEESIFFTEKNIDMASKELIAGEDFFLYPISFPIRELLFSVKVCANHTRFG